jgi:hypothetical protein
MGRALHITLASTYQQRVSHKPPSPGIASLFIIGHDQLCNTSRSITFFILDLNITYFEERFYLHSKFAFHSSHRGRSGNKLVDVA